MGFGLVAMMLAIGSGRVLFELRERQGKIKYISIAGISCSQF